MIILERLRVDRFKGLRDVDLCLPARGSVLVEGLNEAGKSTLFESVYFALYGSLLASEENRGGLESAIAYGAAEATVELAFRVGDTRLVVSRWLRRGRPSRARLRVHLPDGSDEEVGQIAAVNRRIVHELGGLEGAALLDSCFVEQKKLEKLEAMDAREREAALMRLLNLDRLTGLERRFRTGRADEQALAAADARAELAQLRQEVPERAAEETAAARALQALTLRRELDALAESEALAAQAAAERERLEGGRSAPTTEPINGRTWPGWGQPGWGSEQPAAHYTASDRAAPPSATPGSGGTAGDAAAAGAIAAAAQAATAARAGRVAAEATARAGTRRLLGAAALAVLLLAAALAALLLGSDPLGVGLAALGALGAGTAVVLARGWARARADCAAARATEAAMGQALAVAQGQADLAARAGLERALGAATARERLAAEESARRRATVVASLAALDLAAPAELGVAAVARLLPAVAEPPDHAAALAARRDALLAELGALRARQGTVERALGLAAAPLDRAACEADAAALRRDLAVRARALTIVHTARERLVQRVLPNTVRHVQLLLPLLTAGRYRDATITEDYRIRVWDERAGRYVAKHLFSGGTRDQFSLALRLAFALATLPEERGVRPGFLFLDEPLSAFDAPRARALVALLTTGYVADHFAQVFVISHGGPFDRQAFPYALRLAHGRVVESNLPAAPSAPPGADAPAIDAPGADAPCADTPGADPGALATFDSTL